MAKYTPTQAEREAFIEEVVPLAQRAYMTLGKVLPSVCIGMACVESGFSYGTDGSRLMYRHNACWGQKVGSGRTATKYWPGTCYVAATNEEYTKGIFTRLPAAAFRSYQTLEQGCLNYYELLNTSLYKKVLSGIDYVRQMQQIKEVGYMTSSTEVNSVISVIQNYNLTKYDIITHTTSEFPWKIGKTYTTQQDLYIRDSANGNKLNWLQITLDAQKHGFTDKEGKAILKKGTEVTVKNIRQVGSCIWLQIPSGWICGRNSKYIYVA